MTRADYDEDVDILTLRKKGRISHSSSKGNMIIDYDKDGRIVGIEILDASKFFDVPKKNLRNVGKAGLDTGNQGNMATLSISIEKNKEQKIIIPLQA